MNPRVAGVKPNPDFTLELTFENGEKKIFDMNPYLKTGIFRALTNPALFRQAKFFMGSVCWKSGQDLCPDTLYLESKKTYRTPSKTLAVAEPPVKYKKK